MISYSIVIIARRELDGWGQYCNTEGCNARDCTPLLTLVFRQRVLTAWCVNANTNCKREGVRGRAAGRVTVVSSAWSLQPLFRDTLGIFSDLRCRDEHVHFERKCMLLTAENSVANERYRNGLCLHRASLTMNISVYIYLVATTVVICNRWS